MTVNGRQVYPHRHVFEAFYGDIPDGMDVCHHCDNRKCVNPQHLFLGSRKDNMQDAMRKGRVQRGERRYNAVLTEGMVRMAREGHRQGRKISDIAKELGVHKTTLGKAINRETWRHIV